MNRHNGLRAIPPPANFFLRRVRDSQVSPRAAPDRCVAPAKEIWRCRTRWPIDVSLPAIQLFLGPNLIELTGRAKLIGRTSDLSRTGCYVDTFQPFRSGAAVHIQLSHGSETFEAQGTVMYVSPGLGMGVQFEPQIPGKHLAILDRWLEVAARQPA